MGMHLWSWVTLISVGMLEPSLTTVPTDRSQPTPQWLCVRWHFKAISLHNSLITTLLIKCVTEHTDEWTIFAHISAFISHSKSPRQVSLPLAHGRPLWDGVDNSLSVTQLERSPPKPEVLLPTPYSMIMAVIPQHGPEQMSAGFVCNSQTVHGLGFSGHVVSIATFQLCP